MSTDLDDRPPADLKYATEKIIRTVDQEAVTDGPLGEGEV
jgi:hypothetical protein